MTNTMYLNQFANAVNPSFVDTSTRVLPENLVGSWTREPAPEPKLKKPAAPAQDAWRKGQSKDLIATFALLATFFAGAAAAVVLI